MMDITDSLSQFIKALILDERIDSDSKVLMFEQYKDSLIAQNSSCLLDKEEALKHFEWLAMLDNGLKEIQANQ